MVHIISRAQRKASGTRVTLSDRQNFRQFNTLAIQKAVFFFNFDTDNDGDKGCVFHLTGDSKYIYILVLNIIFILHKINFNT